MTIEHVEAWPSDDLYIRDGQVLSRAWKWHRNAHLPATFLNGLRQYFQWCTDNNQRLALQYDPVRMAEHQRMANAYFGDDPIVE